MAASATKLSLKALSRSDDANIASLVEDALTALKALPGCGVTEESPFVDALNTLQLKRAGLPDKDTTLSRLDAAIFPLHGLQRHMFAGGPYDIVHKPAPPSPETAPRVLQDLKETNLFTDVSDIFGVEYLSPDDGLLASWPAEGILYGPGGRVLVRLPASLKDKPPVHVFFFVDTAAPFTELSPSVFTALGCENIPQAATVTLGGFEDTVVQLCDQQGELGNHKDIPVLGADFLSYNSCVLTVDYGKRTVALQKGAA